MKKFWKISTVVMAVLTLALTITGGFFSGPLSLISFLGIVPFMGFFMCFGFACDWFQDLERSNESDMFENHTDLDIDKKMEFSITKDAIAKVNEISERRIEKDDMNNIANENKDENNLVEESEVTVQNDENNNEDQGQSKTFSAKRRVVLPNEVEYDKDITSLSLIERVRRRLKHIEDNVKFEQWLERQYEETNGKSLYFEGERRTSLSKEHNAENGSESFISEQEK